MSTPEGVDLQAPSIEAAHEMGARGGPVVEAERLAFEAWMRGHCWALCATWNGREYRTDAEQGGNLCPHAMRARQLWAAWRDRAALAADATRSLQQEVERLKLAEEGAKEAFGHVVEQTRDLDADCKKLRQLLGVAHNTIMTMARSTVAPSEVTKC